MFDKLGQMAGLMKNLPKIREEMAKLQSKLAQISAEGDAGGGMVKVRVNGNMEVVPAPSARRPSRAATGNCSKT